MADVRITIAGTPHEVRCDDGQEGRLRELAAIVDGKAATVPGGSETRRLLFASLLLADEVSELRAKVEATQSIGEAHAAELDEVRNAMAEVETALKLAATERETLQRAVREARDQASAAQAQPAPANGKGHAATLDRIADRIEALATRVEAAS